jgi:nitrogen fixation/metabolism regulation signal transduction histidine kinase
VTRDDALTLLSSDSAHQRLKGARFLVRGAQQSDLPLLRQARQRENVSYVKKSLDLVIMKLSQFLAAPVGEPLDEFDIPEEVRRQIRSQAVEHVTGILLHEIASPIGLVRRSASREVGNFEGSRTKFYLDSLQRIFEAIEQLKGAAAAPKPEEFDLAELIHEIKLAETPSQKLDVSLHGPTPLIIRSDPTLVRLAVCNGLRNAIEAVAEASDNESHPIVVTWDSTDVDYWVAVLDRGPGLIGPIEPAFEIGKSTKQGHSGFGLAIARQAIETLGGSVTLQPATGGGALYEVRWER